MYLSQWGYFPVPTAWGFYFAGMDMYHILGEASDSSNDIRVIFSSCWLRACPSAAVYKPLGLVTWTFPVPKVVLRILVPLASGSTRSVKKRISCKQGITLLSNVFPLCCLIRIRGIQAKQAFTVVISLAFAFLNPLHLRHRYFVGHYRAFSDFARGPWSIPSHQVSEKRRTAN